MLINNRINPFLHVFGLFVFAYMGDVYPFLWVALGLYAVLIIESYMFAYIYENSPTFNGITKDWLFDGNVKFADTYSLFFFGNMNAGVGKFGARFGGFSAA